MVWDEGVQKVYNLEGHDVRPIIWTGRRITNHDEKAGDKERSRKVRDEDRVTRRVTKGTGTKRQRNRFRSLL